MTVSRYVRTRGGRTIHTADCRHAATGQPWRWADNQPDTLVLAAAETLNYRLCATCKPLAGISRANLNGQLAAAITEGLLNGLPHPKRDDTALTLSTFRAAGLPEHHAKATIAVAEAVGQSVVKLIGRLGATLVENTELAELHRTRSESAPQIVTVRCEHRDLLQLAITGETTRINCQTLRDNLGECAR